MSRFTMTAAGACAVLLLAGCSGQSPATGPSASAAPPATTQPSPSAAPSSASTPPAGVHFGYEGEEGPEHWGDLRPEWETCRTGQAQSPVDLGPAKDATMPQLTFSYPATTWTMKNTGHALQLEPQTTSTLDYRGTTWTLRQLHMHTPSEHVLDGKPAAGELHLVHQAPDGKLLVVGALLDEEGADNPAWSWLSQPLPKQPGDEAPVEGAAWSAQAVLPDDLDHHAYVGSLTTPPCTEGVTWVMLEKDVDLSAAQIDALEQLHGANARPVQPLNGRELTESED